MFSDNLPTLSRQAGKIGKGAPLSPRALRNILEKRVSGRELEGEELIGLLNGTYVEKNREAILDFAAQYQRPRTKDILLLPPLYFANRCENSCLYCNFSSEGVRLSLDDFTDELEALLNLGYRSIELVSSQDPELYIHAPCFSIDGQSYEIEALIPYFRVAREKMQDNGGGMLTSNIPPLDVTSLKKLQSAGLDCYLLWVETFHPEQYARLHPGNVPKSNQAFRLDSLENAAEAGIAHIAGAFLKGLYDWRTEEALLYSFDRHLREKRGKGFSIIGTPRLKGPFTQSPLVQPYQVSDEDYELNIALDRILFDGILWLQTREDPAMNRRFLDRYGAGVILTLDCSTAPGGYKGPSKGKAQFPVFRQKLKKAVQELERSGYNVLFDWNSQTLSSFQRRC